jgi:hypothetical protein
VTGKVPNQERLLQQMQGTLQQFVDGVTREKLLDYILTFETPHGRRVLEDLTASFSGPSLVPGYPDVTAYNEGLRAITGIIGAVIKRARLLGIAPKIP